jgi:hypothetical protein
VAESPGWFALNARGARWFDKPGQGLSVPLTGYDEYEAETFFPMLGMAIRAVNPGEPQASHPAAPCPGAAPHACAPRSAPCGSNANPGMSLPSIRPQVTKRTPMLSAGAAPVKNRQREARSVGDLKAIRSRDRLAKGRARSTRRTILRPQDARVAVDDSSAAYRRPSRGNGRERCPKPGERLPLAPARLERSIARCPARKPMLDAALPRAYSQVAERNRSGSAARSLRPGRMRACSAPGPFSFGVALERAG